MKETKKLFIAGLMSSGTTVFLRVMKTLNFGTSTEPYLEGQQDPKCPRNWKARFGKRFPESRRENIRAWVNSYCSGDWFIEKTPTRFTHFLALQELFGDSAYFIVVQRDPFQTLGARARARTLRNASSRRQGRKRLDAGQRRVLVDDTEFAEMWRGKLEFMTRFHLELRLHLERFQYVRYEDLCANSVDAVVSVLRFLHVRRWQSSVAKACGDLDIRLVHRYRVPELHSLLVPGACELAELWHYPIPDCFKT